MERLFCAEDMRKCMKIVELERERDFIGPLKRSAGRLRQEKG